MYPTALSFARAFGCLTFSVFLFLVAAAMGAEPNQPTPLTGFESSKHIDFALFQEPPREYRQQGWLTLNLTRSTPESMEQQVKTWADKDLAGFYLGISGGKTAGLSEDYLKGSSRKEETGGVAYLSPEYFDLYAKTIESGLKHGNPPIVFYDEWGYPSGMAGGALYSKFPQFAAKSLEKVERDVTGPAAYSLDLPTGLPLGAVRMNLDSRELVEISTEMKAGHASGHVPAGRWKVMAFYLDPKASLGQGNKSGYVDYLDPEAVRTYIALSYQPHYDHLKAYFGHPLQITQYDEPALHMANGKTWTPRFNEYFEKANGYNPMKFYPALWYDIGPDTAAVRNALWGFRAKLYAESYIKQVDDWCREHQILFSGHQDQEEVGNPVGVAGDMMKVFQHQAVPGIDDIWWWGRTNRGYKIITSAAFNWDKPFVLAETYAAYRTNMNPDVVFQVAMDQAAQGTAFQVGALPKDKTPASDRFIGRISYLLQHGRHVADIAVLYPIASLQAAYRFGDWGNAPKASSNAIAWAREGGIPAQTDYIELGETLFRGLRRDFTYLHPEVLADRCVIEGKQLVMKNPVNREDYQVLFLPATDTINLSTAQKLHDFWAAGGMVIATGCIPSKAAEVGRDRAVRDLMDEVFGVPADQPITATFERRIDDFQIFFTHLSPAGGKAIFAPRWNEALLTALLGRSETPPDVAIQLPAEPVRFGQAYAGALTYIHKVKENRDVYFFANSSRERIDTTVSLRGEKHLTRWDPHTGERAPLETSTQKTGDSTVTTAPLVLDPVHAVFFVQEP